MKKQILFVFLTLLQAFAFSQTSSEDVTISVVSQEQVIVGSDTYILIRFQGHNNSAQNVYFSDCGMASNMLPFMQRTWNGSVWLEDQIFQACGGPGQPGYWSLAEPDGDGPVQELYFLYDGTFEMCFAWSTAAGANPSVDSLYYNCSPSVTVDLSNSIASVQVEQIDIYPQPAKDEFRLSSNAGVQRIDIFDANGRKWKSMNNASVFSVADLDAGIYFVRIISNNGHVLTRKCIIE